MRNNEVFITIEVVINQPFAIFNLFVIKPGDPKKCIQKLRRKVGCYFYNPHMKYKWREVNQTGTTE